MPTSVDRPDVLADTSVAVAWLVSDHEQHVTVSAALAGTRVGLAGHAAFETFSVLTRLPPPLRRTPAAAGRMLVHAFGASSRFLPPDAAGRLLERLPSLGIAGGAVYDALVGEVGSHHGVPLVTRDQRALATYRQLSVDVRVIA